MLDEARKPILPHLRSAQSRQAREKQIPMNNTNPLLLLLVAGLGLATPGGAGAQTFTNLHSFGAGEGAGPDMGVAISGSTIRNNLARRQ